MKSELEKVIQEELFDLNLKYSTNKKFRTRVHLIILAIILFGIIGKLIDEYTEGKGQNGYYERLREK